MKHFLGLCRYSECKKLEKKLVEVSNNFEIELFNNFLNKRIIDKYEKEIEKLYRWLNVYNKYIDIYSALKINGEDVDFFELIFNYSLQEGDIEFLEVIKEISMEENVC